MNSPRLWMLLDWLAHRLRLISMRQVLGLGPGTPAFSRRMRRLIAMAERRGLIRKLTILARPVPKISGPLFSWRPDDPGPDAHAIQYVAEKRTLAPVEATTVLLGTEKLANILGGCCGGPLNQHSASHDLAVSEVFLLLFRTDRNLALSWQGEDIIAPTRRRQKLPDAILYSPEGQPVLAIEYIGDYPASRILAFHEDNVSRNLPYEVY